MSRAVYSSVEPVSNWINNGRLSTGRASVLSECTQTQRGTSASPNGSNGGGSGSSGIGNSASSSTSGNTTTSSSSNTTSTSSTSSTSGSSGSSNMAISRVPSPPPPEASTPVAENWCYTQVTLPTIMLEMLAWKLSPVVFDHWLTLRNTTGLSFQPNT